jgi:hypothetical protein
VQGRLVDHEEQEYAMNRLLIAFSILTMIPASHAGELGRLFNTPNQRQQLEFQDSSKISSDADGAPVRNYIIVNGVVQKQGGNRTVWVNGAPQAAGRGNDNTPAAVAVTLPGKDRPVHTKVGQKIMLEQPAEQPSE